MNTTKTVDVVIPTYKPDEKYDRLLQMLKKQTLQPGRIIVMNTEEALYGTHPEAPETVEVHHIRKVEFDHGGTRNEALQMSQADLVLFLTQDAVPADEHLIEHMAACFEQENVAAAYGRQLPAADCNVIETYTRAFNYPGESQIKTKADLPKLGIKTYFCSDVCAMYRRDIYQKLGGFPHKTIFNEDMIFAATVIGAGYGIMYCAEGRVIHSHNYTGAQQFHRNFDLAVSQKQHPEVFSGLRSEGEGIRLVKNTMGYLAKHGKAYLIPKLIYVSGCKYMGFLLGKKYDRLPSKIVRWCSMSPNYWCEM